MKTWILTKVTDLRFADVTHSCQQTIGERSIGYMGLLATTCRPVHACERNIYHWTDSMCTQIGLGETIYILENVEYIASLKT